MTGLDELCRFLDDLLQVNKVVDDLKNGLILRGKQNVVSIGLATNTTFETIENAKKEEIDFLLTHHGGWRELDMNLFDVKMSKLRDNEISVYVAHSSLDNASEFGTADSLARLLEIVPSGRFASHGGGMAGVYATIKPMKFNSFCRMISNAVEGAKVETWRNAGDYVTKLAIVTGKGERTAWLEEAHRLGCDTYLTGEGNVSQKSLQRRSR